MAADIEFDWDEKNQKYLKDHDVSPEEFEQVIVNDPLDLEYQTENGEERYKSVGLTDRGRALIVIWTIRDGKVRAVTAYPAGKAFEKLYREMKQ